MRESLKLIHAAIDEDPVGRVMIRGVIDNDSRKLIQVPNYQRRPLPLSSRKEQIRGFLEGKIPDVYLWMEGESYRCHDENLTHYMQGNIWVIDGLQRLTTLNEILERQPNVMRIVEQWAKENQISERRIEEFLTPKLGASLYFNYREEDGRILFERLNLCRTKLSPNVIARNMAEDWTVMQALCDLSQDRSFVLYDRISKEQHSRRQDIITLVTIVKVARDLHDHIVTGRHSRVDEIVPGLQTAMDKITRAVFRKNIVTLFDTIEQMWGIRNIQIKEGSCWMRSTFLRMLAQVFSEHDDFWRGNELFIDTNTQNKLKSFPVNDPEIIRLSSTAGTAQVYLKEMMVRHLNRGKRTGQLRIRQDHKPHRPSLPAVSVHER